MAGGGGVGLKKVWGWSCGGVEEWGVAYDSVPSSSRFPTMLVVVANTTTVVVANTTTTLG